MGWPQFRACFFTKEMEIEGILWDIQDLNILKTGFIQHPDGLLSAPHHPQALPAVNKTNGHTVHQADSIQKGAHGMILVIREMTACRYVHHGKQTAFFKYGMDVNQCIQGSGLIVNGV